VMAHHQNEPVYKGRSLGWGSDLPKASQHRASQASPLPILLSCAHSHQTLNTILVQLQLLFKLAWQMWGSLSSVYNISISACPGRMLLRQVQASSCAQTGEGEAETPPPLH
jgi:hypothetical protein